MPDKNSNTLLEIEELAISRKKNGSMVELCRNLNLTLSRGEIVIIEGASGQGKSTLLWVIAGLFDFTRGDINLEGKSIKKVIIQKWRRDIGLLMQNSIIFPGTIKENLFIPFTLKINQKIQPFDESPKDKKSPKPAKKFSSLKERGFGSSFDEAINNKISELGLQNISLDQNGDELSTGEAKRVAFLRLLLINPKILLLDEPVANLDPGNRTKFYRALSKYLRQGGSAILVSHEGTVPDFFSDNSIKRYVLENKGLKSKK